MVIGRRHMVAALGAAVALPHSFASAQFSGTPGEVLGPFYPLQTPADADFDMTRVSGRSGRAKGTPIELTGRVAFRNGAPAAGATVEIWQANAAGRYDHPSDTSNVPLDPDFQGFAVLKTDSEGRFRLLSVKPGAYRIPDGRQRTPHVHMQISTSRNRLITQMYFPADTLNDQDFLFNTLKARGDNPEDATAKAIAARQPGVSAYDWTIVI